MATLQSRPQTAWPRAVLACAFLGAMLTTLLLAKPLAFTIVLLVVAIFLAL